MTIGATLLMGRADPLALFDALAADLLARGMLPPERVAAARTLVPSGRLPSTALIDVGAPRDAVLRALATLCGAAPAPLRSEWKLEVRSQLRVDELTWIRLLAVPIGFIDRRPLIAFADVIGITSSAALQTLPDHVPCVALEGDVREALAQRVAAAKAGVSFLAPPSAVAQGLPLAASAAFGAGTAPALAGTMVGAPAMSNAHAGVAPVGPHGAPSLAPQALPSFVPQAGAPSFGSAPPFAATPVPPGWTPPVHSAGSGSSVPTMLGLAVERASAPAPAPQPRPMPHLGPAGTLLGTGQVALDAMRAGQTVSPGAPSFVADAQSPSSPATAQSPFVPTAQPANAGPAVARSDERPAATAAVSVGPGARCGRFLLERKLGEGGMAIVFVGHAVDGQGPAAAVKVVHEHLLRGGQGEELRRRFQREVNAMRQLSHPNIVACLDAGCVGDTEYLATELVACGSLNRVLLRIGKLSPMLALSFFGDLLEGLAHAHDKGVVHRDLKPDNLLVADDGTIKVADFGIARLAEGTQLTATGGIIGTPSYMSPEQALAYPVDARTDLYTAGVILYELLTGRNPFEGDSVAATLGNVLNGKVRPVGEVEPSVPFLVDLVVTRLLSLRPDDRFPSARAVLDALRPVLDRAQELRPAWAALVNKQAGVLASSFAKEAEQYAARARVHQRAAAADASASDERSKAAFAAYRATCLMPDQREAKAVLAALSNVPGAAPIRFARSSTPAIAGREAALESAPRDVHLAEHRALAQLYLDEHNPAFAAHHGRRAAVDFGAQEQDLAFLERLLEASEVEEVRTMNARAGIVPPSSAETMRGKAWRPRAAAQGGEAAGPAGGATAGAATAAAPANTTGAGMPTYMKAAVIIASTAIPIGIAILALRGCS